MALLPWRIAPQLFWNVANAAARSSSCQPSRSAKASGLTCAWRISTAFAGKTAIRLSATVNEAAEREGNPGMQSLSGFGGDEFPVRITRRGIARERPDIGNVAHLVGISVNHLAGFVARHRNDLRNEAHRDLRRALALLGRGDLRLVDGDETAFHQLTALLAFVDRGLEAVIDLARQQVFQGAAVAFGVGVDDHLVGGTRAGDEVLALESRIGAENCIEPRGNR